MSKNFEVLLRAEREAELFQTSTIGHEVPELKQPRVRSPVHIDEKVRQEEAKLVERVFLLPAKQAPRVVVLCAVERRGGEVGICARAGQHLAAQTGLPVCLVEGDLYSPSLHAYFGLDNLSGVRNAISKPGSIRDFVRHLDSGNLSLLSAGGDGEDAPTPWNSDAWRSRMAELRQEYHYVLIVAPPVAQHSDVILLGQAADGVILVLESNLTRRETARAVKQSLEAANVRILGAVLNNRTFPIPESIYKKL